MKPHTTCGLDQAAWFRGQLAPTLRTLEEELTRQPESPRALALAGILAGLAGNEVSVPPLVAAAAARAGRRAPAPDATVQALLWNLWDALEGHGVLTAERAEALARPLVRGLRDPFSLLLLKRRCAPFRHRIPVTLFRRALRKRAPRFLRDLAVLKIDRGFLGSLMTAEEAGRVTLEFHPNGHLRRLASRRARASLELEARPGSGRFAEEGKRGGSGYARSEHYRNGAASGTFCSPWHDGEEYAEAIEWPLWVAEAVRSVVAA